MNFCKDCFHYEHIPGVAASDISGIGDDPVDRCHHYMGGGPFDYVTGRREPRSPREVRGNSPTCRWWEPRISARNRLMSWIVALGRFDLAEKVKTQSNEDGSEQ